MPPYILTIHSPRTAFHGTTRQVTCKTLKEVERWVRLLPARLELALDDPQDPDATIQVAEREG